MFSAKAVVFGLCLSGNWPVLQTVLSFYEMGEVGSVPRGHSRVRKPGDTKIRVPKLVGNSTN